MPRHAAVVIGALKLRIQFQSRIVIRDRAVIVLDRLIGVPTVGEEARLRADLDRFVVVGDRACIVAIAGEVQPAIVEIFRP